MARNHEELRIRSSINDNIPGLHLNAARQAVGDNIANGGGWFNRRNSNLSNERPAAEDQHFGVRFESLARAEIQDDKIVGLINRQNGAAHIWRWSAGDGPFSWKAR